jgi:hypothetical protein
LEGGGGRSRPLRRSGTGDCRRRHRCSRGHHPYTSRRGARRQATSQEGDRCVVAERGEAAGNCVVTSGPLRPAASDRVPLFQGTEDAATPEPKAPAGSTDNEHEYVVGCTESSPQGKVNRPTMVPEVLRSFYVAGGQGDKRRFPDRGDRRTTPPDHVAARGQQN